MAKTKELSRETRAQIAILREQGMKVNDIAARFKVSHGCIVKTLQRVKETGGFKSKSRSGRPRATTPRADNRIHIYAKAHPFATANEISSEVFPVGSSPSVHTIRRRLNKKFHLPSRVAAKKTKLSPKNIKDRIAFCRRYGGWTASQWEDVMFSDESSIEQFSNRPRNVRRPPGKRFDPKYVLPTVKTCPKLMIWGAITAHMRCGLWFMPHNTTINGTVYLEILKEKLQLFMNISNTSKFQHDGAPCHRAKKVNDWLNTNGIEVIGPWPGNSPDLNPIENCWDVVKKEVAKLRPTSTDDLREKIKQVWVHKITPDYLRKLIHSMPTRLAKCLKAGGRHTKY